MEGLTITAGERDGTVVAGDRVAELILGSDGDGEARAGRRRGRGTDGEGSHGRTDGDIGAATRELPGRGRQGHGVRGIEGHHDGGRAIDQIDRGCGEVDILPVAAGDRDRAIEARHEVSGLVLG